MKIRGFFFLPLIYWLYTLVLTWPITKLRSKGEKKKVETTEESSHCLLTAGEFGTSSIKLWTIYTYSTGRSVASRRGFVEKIQSNCSYGD